MINDIPCPVCSRPSEKRGGGADQAILQRIRSAVVFDRACLRCGVAFTVNLPMMVYRRFVPTDRPKTIVVPLQDTSHEAEPVDNSGWFEMDLHSAFIPEEASKEEIPPQAVEPTTPPRSHEGSELKKAYDPFRFELKVGSFTISLQPDTQSRGTNFRTAETAFEFSGLIQSILEIPQIRQVDTSAIPDSNATPLRTVSSSESVVAKVQGRRR